MNIIRFAKSTVVIFTHDTTKTLFTSLPPSLSCSLMGFMIRLGPKFGSVTSGSQSGLLWCGTSGDRLLTIVSV